MKYYKKEKFILNFLSFIFRNDLIRFELPKIKHIINKIKVIFDIINMKEKLQINVKHGDR